MRKRRMAFDTVECVLPKDIDRLCPSIGEVAYVDAYGDGHYKTMRLASITPHYVTFRRGPGWASAGLRSRLRGHGTARASSSCAGAAEQKGSIANM